MKTIKTIMMTLALTLTVAVFAGNETITIKTSAQCEMCKESIEKATLEVEGVKKCALDEETKELKVKYDTDLVSANDIRTAITMVGYSADDMPANEEALLALKPCCKPTKSCAEAKSEGEKKECTKTADATKKSCCASKNADGTKKECTKTVEGEKKECTKTADATKKACCASKNADGTKKECTKATEAKECKPGCTMPCCAGDKVAE